MVQYVALIDGSEGTYGAAFPDVPGCVAMAPTTEDLYEGAVDALREWMSDRVAAGFAPPEARSFDAIISAEPEYAFKGVRAMMVPLLLDAGRSVRANISMDAALLEAVDAAAKRRGLTRSAFLASAARDKIAAEG